MKAALLIVLSLSALALAGPAVNKNNQIDAKYSQQYQTEGAQAKGATVDLLKQWCFSSQMSQQELTGSFKKLVQLVKSSPVEPSLEAAVIGERICQGALVKQQAQDGIGATGNAGADAQAHELVKDVYMDALISCKSRDCTQQLLKIINSNKVDPIRASYYMTRVAVTEKEELKDGAEVRQLAESFIQQQQQQQSGLIQSEAVERQRLFAVTSLIGKWLRTKPQQAQEIEQVGQQVAKTIVERHIKVVGEQEVQQYQVASGAAEQQPIAKKIAKRSAALKALANIPGYLLKQTQGVEEIIVTIAKSKQELVTARQSAIECLEGNEKQAQLLKGLALDQEEPIEVRVAAYRALMTVAYAPNANKDEQAKQQLAAEIIEQIVRHCEEERNQEQDDQFVMYAISHLENLRTSQQPEHAAIKECIAKNKQHYMQIQVIFKKLKQQLDDMRRSSRNYKLEQEFNQIESGLVIEGDLVYASKSNANANNKNAEILPKVVRVNMSMPVMGETVNVVEITVRQDQMDEQMLAALKLVESAKFSSASVAKVVDSFKGQSQATAEKKSAEADLTIKVDGCTIIYLSADDFKAPQGHGRRSARSVYARPLVEEVLEYLKRKPVAFNRGFNFNIDERVAKLVDVEANIIAGLRFESRANARSAQDFEIVAQMEPRLNLEAIVGPSAGAKKLLQRLSTKSALGLRLRYKKNQIVDVELELPMNTMELFTFESQLVERSRAHPGSYSYLPESDFGAADIYKMRPSHFDHYAADDATAYDSAVLVKRSILDSVIPSGKQNNKIQKVAKMLKGKRLAYNLETSEKVARATGLRARLRAVAEPKDMGVLVSCVVQKYEPSMRGFRVQLESSEQGAYQKQYVYTISTPNSRLDRTIQVRVSQQATGQRTSVKADIKSAQVSAAFLAELVHDGRQSEAKVEVRAGAQRHAATLGLLSGGQSASGRIATTYKPYLSIESSSLKRPVQMQGVVSYQSQPKTVISYELKCPTTGDFLQGKLIVDQRDSASGSQFMRKRSLRSMQSPIEIMLTKDVTLTHELVSSVREHALKVHQMAEWENSRSQLQADFQAAYKNARKAHQDQQVVASLKLGPIEQALSVERKCAGQQQAHKEFRVDFVSRLAGQRKHELAAECRYNGRRQSLVAYKHKLDIEQATGNKFEAKVQLQLVASELSVNEQLEGRVRLASERKQKTVQLELASRQKTAKFLADYQSLAKHYVQFQVEQIGRFAHKTEVRANERQFALQSRTEQRNQPIGKLVVEVNKQEPANCQLVLELPAKRVQCALDLKLASGEQSSVAVMSPRFTSRAEFSFEQIARKYQTPALVPGWLAKRAGANLRLRSQLKDLLKKEAYWMESEMNAAEWDKKASFIRLDSPTYRADFELEPGQSVLAGKMGAFARARRSVGQFEQIYTSKHSALANKDFDFDKVMDVYNSLRSGSAEGPAKLWAARYLLEASPLTKSLVGKLVKGKLDFAGQTGAMRHQFSARPQEGSLSFDFDQHARDYAGPMSVRADLALERPSTLAMESPFVDFDLEAKPYDGESAFARLSAVSRHRRSPFKAHESEYRYKKHEGHKAWAKHQDKGGERHEWRMEADEAPAKWAKMSYESEKHGKANWEHKWRKQAAAAANNNNNKDNKDNKDNEAAQIYANKMQLSLEAPKGKWAHQSALEWEEPARMAEGRRYRRAARYGAADYLKHTGVRANSVTRYPAEGGQLYSVDFDYKPQQAARLSVALPNELAHDSALEMEPEARAYKFTSKLYNARTSEPTYQLALGTKLPAALASGEQEPVFVHSTHPMLERPISSQLYSNLFKQPLKLDYSDKYGRLASLDYDYAPMAVAMGAPAPGLRQKRAAVYYKDAAADFEHSAHVDFYPELAFGRVKPAYKRAGQTAVKVDTKYGPLVVRAETSRKSMMVEVESPVASVKLIDTTQASTHAIKIVADNKGQRAQLYKLIKEVPVARELELVKRIARKFDSSRFEHQTDMLINLVEAIISGKSETRINGHQTVAVEGEWNQKQNKAFVRIHGERVEGQMVVDLFNKSTNLVLNIDNERTLKHVTRIVRTSNKFYTIDSMTSRKSEPIFKLTGKIAAILIEEPEHMFAIKGGRFTGSPYNRRGSSTPFATDPAHLSAFEAIVYEPSEYIIKGQFDCEAKEMRVIYKDIESKIAREAVYKFDDDTQTLLIDGAIKSAYDGQTVAKGQAKINIAGIFGYDQCQKYGGNKYETKRTNKYTTNDYRQYESVNSSTMDFVTGKPTTTGCQSEIIYSDKMNNVYAAKFVPNEFISFMTPSSKQIINLAY